MPASWAGAACAAPAAGGGAVVTGAGAGAGAGGVTAVLSCGTAVLSGGDDCARAIVGRTTAVTSSIARATTAQPTELRPTLLISTLQGSIDYFFFCIAIFMPLNSVIRWARPELSAAADCNT